MSLRCAQKPSNVNPRSVSYNHKIANLDRARLCAKMPKCKAFVIKGHKYDWKHEYIIFFKKEEGPSKKNPSMGRLFKELATCECNP